MSRLLFETPTGSHKVTQCPLGKHVVVRVIILFLKRQLWFQNMVLVSGSWRVGGGVGDGSWEV